VNLRFNLKTDRLGYPRTPQGSCLEKIAKEWDGHSTIIFDADYDRTEKRLYGTEGDGLRYQWVTPDWALKLLLENPVFNGYRIDALTRYL
jgi:hypothetical protein